VMTARRRSRSAGASEGAVMACHIALRKTSCHRVNLELAQPTCLVRLRKGT
jgi:hypothetical protein